MLESKLEGAHTRSPPPDPPPPPTYPACWPTNNSGGGKKSGSRGRHSENGHLLSLAAVCGQPAFENIRIGQQKGGLYRRQIRERCVLEFLVLAILARPRTAFIVRPGSRGRAGGLCFGGNWAAFHRFALLLRLIRVGSRSAGPAKVEEGQQEDDDDDDDEDDVDGHEDQPERERIGRILLRNCIHEDRRGWMSSSFARIRISYISGSR